MSDTAPDATGPKEVNPMKIDSGDSGRPAKGMTIDRPGERGPIGDATNFTPAEAPPGGFRPGWVADRPPVGSGEAAVVAAGTVEEVTVPAPVEIPAPVVLDAPAPTEQTEETPVEQQQPVENLQSPGAVEGADTAPKMEPAKD